MHDEYALKFYNVNTKFRTANFYATINHKSNMIDYMNCEKKIIIIIINLYESDK